MTPDVTILGAVLAAIAIGQSCLSASLLAIREDPRGIYRPLLIFFVAAAVAKFLTIAEVFAVSQRLLTLRHVIDLTSILAYTLIAPALWIYVRALTSETALRVDKGDLWHLSAFIIGLVVSGFLLSTPTDVRHNLIGDGEGAVETPAFIFLAFGMLFLMLTWITQAVIYVAKVFKRLVHYRTRLKDLFASTEGRELHWISWVVILLGANVLVVISDMFFSVSPRTSLIADIFYLAMVWVLSAWGLRATPSIEGAGAPSASEDIRSQNDKEPTLMTESPKYEKSPLTSEHMARISEKLGTTMQQQKLYLEPALSLRDLAKAVSTPPNYLSQTLNGRIGETFFDYVNAWRIKDAIPMIVGSKESIQNIVYDVGFNSRSSFYKAFKRETGMTPSAYRAKHAKELQART